MKCRKGNLLSTLKISAVEKIQSEVLKAIILEHLQLSHVEIEGHHYVLGVTKHVDDT